MTDISGYAPVPGPADRESFFDAQVRHRRASWWFTALSAGAIGLMGVPLSAVISPLLYAAAVLVLDLVNLVARTPDLLRRFAESEAGRSNAPLTTEQLVVLAVFVVVPGSVVLLLSWLGVRRVFRRAATGGTLLALGAREPRAGDLEEHQLVNVAGEMAAAAGVPAPRVMLLDADVPNAAAVGTRMDDATLVVTTGLLATLDRDETQAVIGHLVASVGNGDLRIGATVSSVFQTLGLVGSVLRAPSEGKPRTTLRRLLRWAFRRRGADDTAAAAELLTRAGAEWETDAPGGKEPGGFKSMLLLPFVMAGGAFMLTSMIFGFLYVNPFLRRGWRARRHLADAAAVQLTRNPDALARALAKLATTGNVVPGTEWAAHLFVVSRPLGWQRPRGTKDESPMTTFHPSVPSRVQRLNAMGASVEVPGGVRTAAQRRALVLTAVVTAPCWLPLAGVFTAIAFVLTGVSLAIDSLFLAPMVAVAHLLLRKAAGG
ncbi:MAG TPA: M48 family metalloprotease [Mycobacteriales bacterium]|jgi:Zn-dependent protease with chaperone function|nr:M48 family metalloprotease [Mycobacteriales bacterium]